MTKMIELFEKNEGKWRPLSIASCTGKAIRKEIWASMEGKEITGKLTRGGEVVGYVAGTEDLREFYRTKSSVKVWSWIEAAGLMESSGSELLNDRLHAALAETLRVFGDGCKILQVKYN